MKKTLIMILAAATAASMSITAMAQDMNGQTGTPVQAAAQSTAQNAAPEGDPTGLQFGADKNRDNAVLEQTVLEPGVEYRFPVYMIFDGKAYPLHRDMLKDMRFSYNKLSNTAVKTFRIDEYKDGYYLFVEMKNSVPNEINEIKYNVKLTRRDSKLAVFSQEIRFRFGYGEYPDEVINQLEKGDEIEINNQDPVITDEQFERIAKINDYKKVILSGPSWAVEANVTDESTKNLLSNNAGLKVILSRFPEQEFKFWNFPGKPSFAAAGKVHLDVEDIIDEFAQMYVYRFANDKIYGLNATLNEDTHMMEFRTNRLDNFFVTDKKIPEGFMIKDDTADSKK